MISSTSNAVAEALSLMIDAVADVIVDELFHSNMDDKQIACIRTCIGQAYALYQRNKAEGLTVRNCLGQ